MSSVDEPACSIMRWINADDSRKYALEWICRGLSYDQYLGQGTVRAKKGSLSIRMFTQEEYEMLNDLLNYSIHRANELAHRNPDGTFSFEPFIPFGEEEGVKT